MFRRRHVKNRSWKR